MKLSILILTHNRSALFKRCINSILSKEFPFNVEILINNDSNDIDEIYHDKFNIKYYYKKYPDNLGMIYDFLYNQSSGEYIYFLEDDDYLTQSGLLNIDFLNELYYMNYIGVDKKATINRIKDFKIETFNQDFQIGQILFKKNLINMYYYRNNYLHNDWKMFQELKKKVNVIKLIKTPAFIQTIDGNDNISFKKYNKDNRWIL